MAKKRALESPSVGNRVNMAKKGSIKISVDNMFLSKAKMGPDYVCTCCHRMMYQQNVPCNKSSLSTLTVNSLTVEHSYMMANYGCAGLAERLHFSAFILTRKHST